MMKLALLAAALLASASAPAQPPLPAPAAIDAAVRAGMARTHARGFALAVIDDGRVRLVRAWGERNAAGDPLTNDTIMYGASLTKAAFAYLVLQLADEGVVDLDRSIAEYLPRPLPDYADGGENYADWRPLAGDDRWRLLTPRILLSHRSGFANFGFLEPDRRLRFHFDPGTRYAYSGDGLILLQFVLERGMGLDVGAEMQRRIFDRFGMTNSAMRWRPDFARNLADGWTIDGEAQPHDERSRVRAAGSLDTTIADYARFAAALVRGEGLRPATRRALATSELEIRTASEFPTLQPDLPAPRWPGLGAGIGVTVFTGPQGPAFFKGGHDDITGNLMICVERGRRCLLMMSNDVRAEGAFQDIATAALGETGFPWGWEYSRYAH